MTQQTTDLGGQVLGNLLGDALKDLNAQGQAFAADAQKQREQVEAVQKALFAKLSDTSGKVPTLDSLPVEIKNIVNGLLAQPRLIPYIDQKFKDAVNSINAAVDSVLEGIGVPPQKNQPVQTQQTTNQTNVSPAASSASSPTASTVQQSQPAAGVQLNLLKPNG